MKTVELAKPANLDQVINQLLNELSQGDLAAPGLLHLARGSWTVLEEALARLERLGLVVRKTEGESVTYGLTDIGKEAVALRK